MPAFRTWHEFKDFEAIADAIESGSPIYHVGRPILLHDRNNSGAICPCGCNSRKAKLVKTIPHLSVLLERRGGARVFRTAKNAAWFDAMAGRDTVERINMPHRSSRAQFHIVRDVRDQWRRGKQRTACIAFGGNRSGKTTTIDEIEVDLTLMMGGPGCIFLNVAPTLEKNTVSLKKLVAGDAADRQIVPMIDRRLIAEMPERGKIERDGEKVILVDGTEIQFRHGGQAGGNLKSIAPQAIFVDELCEIKKIENWLVLMNRTIDTGGAIFGATTPVQGHWAKDEIVSAGTKLDEAGPEDNVVWTHLSCFDNPFVSKKDIERRIASLNDERLVRRDVYGEWVPEGLTLWEFWDGRDYTKGGLTFDGPWRPEAHGFTNITERALGHSFRRCKAKRKDHFGGVDFNVKPMSLIDMMIVVKDGDDEDNPQNWILWVPQEVVRDGGVLKFADHLEMAAHKDLGLDDDWFESMALACDSTGAQRNNETATRHGITNLSSSLVDFLKVRDHDARPCNLSDNGNPANPDQIRCLGLVHKLMRDDRIRVHRTRCKRLIRAFESQEQTSEGKINKEPGKFTDKLSGPTDGLRYGAWMLLHKHEPEFSRKVRFRAA